MLSWNEIKDRALKFSKEWANTSSEDAEAQSFLEAFFNVFGISRKRFATFEHKVKKLNDKDGYIDLLWKGNILIEMKSSGKDLDRAYNQAKEYTFGLKDYELPKFILVCDFQNFKLHNLENDEVISFALDVLYQNVQHFGFMIGITNLNYSEQDPANIKAAELMGKLHDQLKEIGYEGHPLEVYLVRLLFCLFAEDTSIFNKLQFQEFITYKTNEDGSDLAAKLQELFQTLNTPENKRYKNLDDSLAEFPYVNGKLFEENLPTASFDSKMRNVLLESCALDWSKISPAIFGSMFQSVMNPKERRNLGAHYTSEKNILKVIKPLFLDELWAEFEKIKSNKNKLRAFHTKISELRILDPACGCGNFLIITYRELRLLEIAILSEIYSGGQAVLNINDIVKLDVDMMYGIEYEEFPAKIAEVAMWLVDHQMNLAISEKFGQYFLRLPLKKAANIIHGNALRIEWQSLLNPENTIHIKAKSAEVKYSNSSDFKVSEPTIEYGNVKLEVDNFKVVNKFTKHHNEKIFDYIIGNPPFIGSKMMTVENRKELLKEFDNINGAGILDYVAAWYVKAAKFIQGQNTKVAFVSTNSITQGEQVSILWGTLLNKYKIHIHFAHRTFKWSNEASGNAAVYCVIIGFANYDTENKKIFDYKEIKGDFHEIEAKNINPYLKDARNVIIGKRTKPLCDVPKMNFGNIALDSGHLIFNEIEKEDFIKLEQKSEIYFKELLGAIELLYNRKRWCLWLVDIMPNELKTMKHVLKKVESVKEARLNANDKGTQRLASRPYQFRDLNNPENYIAIPITTGENRDYIPLVFADKSQIPAVTVQVIPNGTKYEFGILHSKMHMAWVKSICGRLESRFRYSKDIVYNNFPWPENPNEKQKKEIEKYAQLVLDVRNEYPNSSLADLYDPLTMPPKLVDAHNKLDKAVEKAFKDKSFINDDERIDYLFELYEKYTANLFTEEKKKKGRKKL